MQCVKYLFFVLTAVKNQLITSQTKKYFKKTYTQTKIHTNSLKRYNQTHSTQQRPCQVFVQKWAASKRINIILQPPTIDHQSPLTIMVRWSAIGELWENICSLYENKCVFTKVTQTKTTDLHCSGSYTNSSIYQSQPK